MNAGTTAPPRQMVTAREATQTINLRVQDIDRSARRILDFLHSPTNDTSADRPCSGFLDVLDSIGDTLSGLISRMQAIESALGITETSQNKVR